MPTPDLLLARLDAVAASFARTEHALALVGLGSVGTETDRLDEHSDLDFFAIVADGHRGPLLDDLGWLWAAGPRGTAFRNTPDGYKLLYGDGVFCEMAVLEPSMLAHIPFTGGRLVWCRDGVDGDALLRAGDGAGAGGDRPPTDVTWELGEALTNLAIGLGRFRRGERLSAARFVQGHAVDRVLALAALLEEQAADRRESQSPTTAGATPDPFAPDRRVEQRLPSVAAHLGSFVQGYDRTPESARAILDYLETHLDVDPVLAAWVRGLLDG